MKGSETVSRDEIIQPSSETLLNERTSSLKLGGGAGKRLRFIGMELLSYSVACLSVALALGITLWLGPLFKPTPTPLLFMAVMVSAWLGGWKPGLVSTILSTLAINYYFVPPYYSLNIAQPGSLFRLGVFITAALLISGLNASRRQAVRREQRLRSVSEMAQREAESAKEHLEAVLSSINDAFFVLDRNWRLTYINDRACAGAGMGRDALLGQNIWELFPEAAGSEAEIQFLRALREQTPVQFEYFDARRGGTGFLMEDRIQATKG